MEIYFGQGFEGLGAALAANGISAKRVLIVADTNTEPLYAKSAREALSGAFSEIYLHVIPAGEENKNLARIEAIYAALLENGFDRSDFVAALGGGVVGDMAGFAAATYLRGIRFIQLPTTLLSQVDSSIGGKCGVDFHAYKNMVGAFHMPSLIYEASGTLKTLDDEQFASGMGEVIKTALLADHAYYEWIIENMDAVTERESGAVHEMIERAAKIKSGVVERDPKEKGERALLNLGHTVGHAIEKFMEFRLLHGHCVALGLLAAAKISHDRGYISTEELYELRDILVMFGLPIMADGLDPEEILRLTKSDKKMKAGRIRFILLEGMGKAFIAEDVTDEEILTGIAFVDASRYMG